MCSLARKLCAVWLSVGMVLLACAAGCQTVHHSGVPQSTPMPAPVPDSVPRELSKTILPSYVIEPPDILLIDALHIVPKPPYHLRTLDVLNIRVQPVHPEAPIDGVYPVQAGGRVDLGFHYGSAAVGGLTVEEAEQAIHEHLRDFLAEPFVVSATLADTAARQQIAGEHLVGPDGTITLGAYGSVPVVGLTLAGAKQTIERHLAQYLENPEVSVDVYAYNSKVYYVITQGAGLGDRVYRFPVTGNETVLDAISQINGLDSVSSKRIWIARPTRTAGKVQVLPVCWDAIAAQGSPASNYQLLPGDRVYIAQNRLIAFDTNLAKLTAPFERIMGFSLLGAETITRFSGNVLRGGGNPRGRY